MSELKAEQREAIMHDEGNVLVSASAGSGKTFVMIERAIRLICEGKANVKEILAATFTEAAASEMKERLKKALTEKIAQGETRLAEQLSDVYTADICTLHSFCGRIIRTYFFAAGVAPDFKVIDVDEAETLRAEAMDETFKAFYDGKEQWFLTITDRYKRKRSDKSFKELVAKLYDYCESERDSEEFMQNTLDLYTYGGHAQVLADYKCYLVKRLNVASRELERILYEFRQTENEGGIALVETMLSDIEDIKAGDAYTAKRYENYLPKYSIKIAKEEDEALRAAALDVRTSLKKTLKMFCSNLTDEETDVKRLSELKEHTENLFRVVRAFGERYAAKKEGENALDFTDLERRALRVLKDKEAAQAIKKRYKYIFVDEYQDVNGVQEAIISEICDNNLFMVGDVKQSIYGFRGCRPEIFSGKMKNMRERGEKTILLNHNFRSSDAVINAVNDVFSYSMTEEFFGQNYKDSSALIAGGVYEGGGTGRAELHLLQKAKEEKEKEEPRVYDLSEEIYKSGDKRVKPDISALIANIIRGELTREYYNPKEKKNKRVGYSDIVILSRNKSGPYVENLVGGLVARGIPVASEVKQNICEYPETATLLNALKLIDRFTDDAALVSVLKSPIGGFTEEDLAGIALYYSDNYKGRRGGFLKAFNYFKENADSPLINRITAFSEYFEKMRFLSDYYGAGRILSRIISDCDYEEYLLSEPLGEKKIARVKRLLSLTENGGRQYTVSEFLKKAENGGDAFTVSECGGEDNVRIMTVHASKGLEFPVVIMCGLERGANTSDEIAEVLSDRDYGFAVKYYDDEKRTFSQTPLRGLIKEKLRENRMKEELRLFYVATTRAAYSLHLTFEGETDKRKAEFDGANSFLDYVPADMPVTVWTEDDLDSTEYTREPRKILLSRTDEKLIGDMKKRFAWTYPFEQDTKLPLKTAVTAAAHYENNLKAAEKVDVDRENHGATDEKKGVVAHRIMENLDFSRASEFDLQIKNMLNGGILTEEEASGISLERIRRAANSEVFKTLKDKRLFREKSFIAELPARSVFGYDSDERVLLQGVIDLLAVGEKDVVVIDYKYSLASDKLLVSRYKKQLDLYAEVAEELLGKKVSEKIIVNLFSGAVIAIP